MAAVLTLGPMLQADANHDKRLARHLASLYWETQPEKTRAAIPIDTLREYIAFARNKVQPRLGEEAIALLAQGYLEMRMAGQDPTGAMNRSASHPTSTRPLHLSAFAPNRVCVCIAKWWNDFKRLV